MSIGIWTLGTIETHSCLQFAINFPWRFFVVGGSELFQILKIVEHYDLVDDLFLAGHIALIFIDGA
jgi:hypothetical protein